MLKRFTTEQPTLKCRLSGLVAGIAVALSAGRYPGVSPAVPGVVGRYDYGPTIGNHGPQVATGGRAAAAVADEWRGVAHVAGYEPYRRVAMWPKVASSTLGWILNKAERRGMARALPLLR